MSSLFNDPVIQHVSESNRAVGMFPITPELMGVIMALEGRTILLKSGAYSFVGSASNIRKLQEFFGESLQVLGGVKTAQAQEYKVRYEPITEPYDHQIRAAKFLEHKSSAALFAEQGTGKTKIAIDHFCNLFLNDEIDCVVVVAPSGVHTQWINSELIKHCGIHYDAYAYYSKPISFIGRDPKRLTIITTTYGKLCSIQATPFIASIQDEFSKIMFIMDESHFIKSTQTNRWKGCYKFSQGAKYRLALTGTPIAKKLADEWAQLKCVDENVIGIESLAAFQREYEPSNNWGHNFYNSNQQSADPIERFKEVTKDVVFRCRKDELDIAPKTYSQWAFPMTKEQRNQFIDVALNLRAQIEAEQLTIEFACMALVKLRQIGSGFIIDQNGTTHLLDPLAKNPRLNALMDIIESNDEPIIVWYTYINDGKYICETLDNADIDFVHYKGSAAQKREAIDKFNNGEARIFVGNPASGGVGLNLQLGGCRKAVYYSHNDNSIQRWQSEDRIHRIGQKGICEYVDLIAEGSTDLETLARTAKKKQLADYTLDNILAELDGYIAG